MAGAPAHSFPIHPSPTDPTSATFGAGFAFDANGSTGVLFGGEFGSTLENSSCVLARNAGTWKCWADGLGVPYPAPSPRDNFSFATDTTTDTGVLFGGLINASTPTLDSSTWTLNFTQAASGNEGAAWINVTHAVAPPAREDAAFAIDPTLDVGLLAGGWNPDYQGSGPITFQDVWEINLTTYNWTRLPVTLPEAVGGAALAWDLAVGSLVLFGGGPIDGGRPSSSL